MEKAREFQKNIYLCFTDYAKAFDYVVPGSSPGWIQGIQGVDCEAREVYRYRFIDLEL